MDGETRPSHSASGPDPKIRLIATDTDVGCFRMQGSHLNLAAFLQRQALDHHNKHVSKTYVLEDENRIVLAYVSLCCGQVELEHPIDDVVDYKYPVPAVRIGKLAVCDGFERKGYGSQLVNLAIAIAKNEVRSAVGCRFLLVDSHQDAIEFYKKNGFVMINTKQNQKRRTPVMFLDIGKL
jgi:GNAT superfamily N-acetyltransferase